MFAYIPMCPKGLGTLSSSRKPTDWQKKVYLVIFTNKQEVYLHKVSTNQNSLGFPQISHRPRRANRRHDIKKICPIMWKHRIIDGKQQNFMKYQLFRIALVFHRYRIDPEGPIGAIKIRNVYYMLEHHLVDQKQLRNNQKCLLSRETWRNMWYNCAYLGYKIRFY